MSLAQQLFRFFSLSLMVLFLQLEAHASWRVKASWLTKKNHQLSYFKDSIVYENSSAMTTPEEGISLLMLQDGSMQVFYEKGIQGIFNVGEDAFRLILREEGKAKPTVVVLKNDPEGRGEILQYNEDGSVYWVKELAGSMIGKVFFSDSNSLWLVKNQVKFEVIPVLSSFQPKTSPL